MRAMRMAETESDSNFNIDYIVRQIEAMRDGPAPDEAHIMLQLQHATPDDVRRTPAGQIGMPRTPLAAPNEALGVVAATARMSRRLLTVEFRAIYVRQRCRGQNLASALVYFALDEVRHLSQRGEMPWDEQALDAMICARRPEIS